MALELNFVSARQLKDIIIITRATMEASEGGSVVLCEAVRMMMSFICSCRNKIGDKLYIYLEEGTDHKRLFRGPSTNDMKK